MKKLDIVSYSQGWANGVVMATLNGLLSLHIHDDIRNIVEYIMEETKIHDIQFSRETALDAMRLFGAVSYSHYVLLEEIKKVFGNYVDLENVPNLQEEQWNYLA